MAVQGTKGIHQGKFTCSPLELIWTVLYDMKQHKLGGTKNRFRFLVPLCLTLTKILNLRGINKKADLNKLEVWAPSQVKGNKSSLWLMGLQSYMAKYWLKNGVHIYICIQACWTLHHGPVIKLFPFFKSGTVFSLMFSTYCSSPLLKSLSLLLFQMLLIQLLVLSVLL